MTITTEVISATQSQQNNTLVADVQLIRRALDILPIEDETRTELREAAKEVCWALHASAFSPVENLDPIPPLDVTNAERDVAGELTRADRDNRILRQELIEDEERAAHAVTAFSVEQWDLITRAVRYYGNNQGFGERAKIPYAREEADIFLQKYSVTSEA